jgi:quinol-cytochrome oxidoreductase complex cytochrome b subunit
MATPRETPAGGSRIVDWFEERLQARALFGALLHVRIPAQARTYYLGGITLFLFGIQVVTGTLLSLYYKPTPETAYDSVKYITSVVEFGWLIRSVHHWAANLMIICLVLHLVRIFVQGAYKYPRELTWIVGVGLLAATIGFGFTGYLLPWDQRAFWATTVGTEIAGGIPAIGNPLLQLLRGGSDVTDATLSRFFGMHVLVLPLMIGAFLVVHLTIVHQLGLANPKRPEPRPGRASVSLSGAVEKLKPFFPHYVLDEVIAWAVMLAMLVVLASVLPAGLEEKANPLETPAHVKPEWYFLSVYQLLKVVPRDVGIMAPVVAIVALGLLPFLDRNPEVRAPKRPFALLIGAVAAVATVGLSIWGYYS